jgi:uncharacterized membrane protein YhaH (DUF805 family)
MSDIQQKGVDEIYCSACGAIIKKEAEICPKCGVQQKPVSSVGVAAGGQKMGWLFFADAMKKYVVFSGRARRAEFWWYCVCVFAIGCFASLISIYVIGSQWFSNIVSLGLCLPGIAVGWRRMHDVGKPGGYCFIPIYDIILAAQPGIPGPNQYGPDPKEI